MISWIKKIIKTLFQKKNENKIAEFEDIIFPLKNFDSFKIENKSMLGDSYYFFNFIESSIISPISGFVSKLYDDYCSIKIVNNRNLQILLRINIKSSSLFPLKKIFRCKIFEGMEINKGDEIFYVYLDDEITYLSLHLLWQPDLIKKVLLGDKNKNDDYFLKVYYNINLEDKKTKFGFNGEYI